MIAPSSSLLLLVLAAALAPASAARAQEPEPAPQEPPCKCSTERVDTCFTVHGRVSVYRSAPIVRIAVAGTKRVLALKGGIPEFLEEDLEIPGNVVTGDFLVCPLTRRKAGAMQVVCIESASNMVLTEKKP